MYIILRLSNPCLVIEQRTHGMTSSHSCGDSLSLHVTHLGQIEYASQLDKESIRASKIKLSYCSQSPEKSKHLDTHRYMTHHVC